MNGDIKKPQIVLCLIAGVGFFLPLYKISAYGESVSVSFMEVFNTADSVINIISGKIVFSILISAFVMLLVRLRFDSFALKLVSLLLLLTSGILFYIDVDKMSAAKALLSSLMKYGMGYYMALIGIILAFILGLIDIFASSKTGQNSNYQPMNDAIFNDLKEKNNIMNNNSYNISKDINVVENKSEVTNTQEKNIEQNSQIKLSDLVNHNTENQDINN